MPIQLTTMEPSARSRDKAPLDKIDPDVKQAVDEGLEWCKTNDGRLVATFGSQAEADQFLNDARDYASQTKPRVAVVIGNTTKKGQARFRVEPYVKTSE